MTTKFMFMTSLLMPGQSYHHLGKEGETRLLGIMCTYAMCFGNTPVSFLYYNDILCTRL